MKTILRALCLSAIFVGATALCAPEAHADACDDAQESTESGGKNYKTVIGPDGRKVFVIQKAFVVCGKVPKPSVIYVLQASSINYEWESLKKEFLTKIKNSTKKAPF